MKRREQRIEKRIGSRRGAQGAAGTELLLLAVVCVLIFVVMFAHMTAIKNIGIGIAALSLICVGGFAKRRDGNNRGSKASSKSGSKLGSKSDGKRDKPGANAKGARTAVLAVGWPTGGLLLPMVLWALWSLLSIGWSVFSEASVAAWLDEVAYPFIGFFAFYRLATIARIPPPSPTAQQLGRPTQDLHLASAPRYAVYVESAAWIAIVMLAVLSAMQRFGTASPGVTGGDGGTSAAAATSAAGASAGWLDVLHFLGAPVEVGTLALIVIPFFLAMCARTATMTGAALLVCRLLALSGAALALAAGFMVSSIAFPVCAALTMLIAVVPAWRHRVWLGALVAILLLALALLVTPFMQDAERQHGMIAPAAQGIAPSAQAITPAAQEETPTAERVLPGLAAAAASATFASSATSASPPSSGSASSNLVANWLTAWRNILVSDTHPTIWRFFAEQGLAHPWIGVGFGKPLAAYAYGADAWSAQWSHWAQSSRGASAVMSAGPDSADANGVGQTSQPARLRGLAADAPPAQAHDMLLNTWLQLGVVGVALQLWLWLALANAYLRSGPANGWLKAAGVALVVGVFCHNLFNDVLLQSTLLAFWAHAGWTLGRARLSGFVAGSRSSGRAVAMRRLRRVGN